jgi:hypothetical protein
MAWRLIISPDIVSVVLKYPFLPEGAARTSVRLPDNKASDPVTRELFLIH